MCKPPPQTTKDHHATLPKCIHTIYHGGQAALGFCSSDSLSVKLAALLR